MSETVIQRPTSIHIELHVDPLVEEEDNDENDISLTTKTWRVQFLRLAQRAPQPIPVLCKEPRTFPHFGNVNRISESSWTSDTTHSTDITENSYGLLVSTTNTTAAEKGANEDDQIAPVICEDDSSFKTELSTPNAKTKDVVVVVVDDDDDDDGGGSSSSAKVEEGIEMFVDGNGVDGIDEVRDVKLSSSRSFPQEDSNGKVHVDRKHQLQQKGAENRCTGSRHTLSLSIQGDSEYWEKFRYSKDYQSSLMIETICNEVFNLRPSPRYKSLLKLSETGSSSRKMSKDKRKIESPPQLAVACNDNDDENGIKVEIVDPKKKGARTKEVKSISPPPPPLEICNEEEQEGQDKNVITSFSCGKHQQQKEENIEDDGDGNVKEDLGRKSRNNSTTSSVYTTTTATTQDALENEWLRRERLFGAAFHGYLTKRETEKLLNSEGQYLIRQMLNEDGFILSFRYDSTILNYRLLCDVEYSNNGNGTRDTFTTNLSDDEKAGAVSCTYYLEDRRKCFRSVDELVREGLITLHLDENAGSYIDLLVELAQFSRNSNLLQNPTAGTPGSRKPSRSASFRVAKLPSTSSTTGIGGGGSENGDDNNSSITDERFSRDIALRIHLFEEEIFDRFVKCKVCTNGIWSFSNKGLRCRDCSLCVHESCIDNVKTECEPDLTMLPPFSTDLTSLVKGNRKNSTNHSFGPPYILEKCITELEARGLAAEGIYRICGSVEDIEKLKSMFEQDKINADLSKHPDIHSITGLIKLFLRQLPDPLITQDVFDEFSKDKSNIDEMKIDAVQILVYCLPPAHRLTLRYILEHLQRVTLEKASNKMNAFNLSSVLMPSILCPENMSFDTLESGTKLLHFLITHVEQIFKR